MNNKFANLRDCLPCWLKNTWIFIVKAFCVYLILFIAVSAKCELIRPFNWLLPDGNYVVSRTAFLPTDFPVGQFKTPAEAMSFAENVRDGKIKLEPKVENYELLLYRSKSVIRAVNLLTNASVVTATNIFIGISDDYSWSYSEYNNILFVVSNRIDELQGDQRCMILTIGAAFISEMRSLGLNSVDWAKCEYSSNYFVGKSRQGGPIRGEATVWTNNLIYEMVIDYSDADTPYKKKFSLHYNDRGVINRVLISVSDDSAKTWHLDYEYKIIRSEPGVNELNFDTYLAKQTNQNTSITVYDLKTKKLLFRRIDGSYLPVMTLAQVGTNNASNVTVKRRLAVGGLILVTTALLFLFLRKVGGATNK